MDARRETQRRRPQPRSSGPNMAPMVGVLLVIVAAVGLSLWLRARGNAEAKAAADAAEAADSAPKPFAKYRDERPPVREPKGDAQPYRAAPQDLADAEAWVNALAIAKDADQLLLEANAAREAGDTGGYQDKGRAAKEAYDRALELSALWEEEIVEAYGERNPEVRKIVRTRSRWFDKLRVLHKTTGR